MSAEVNDIVPRLNLKKQKTKRTTNCSVKNPSAVGTTNFTKSTRAWFLASALYDGIEDEDLEHIKKLLEDNGADPNQLLPEYGITPFHLVVGNPCKPFALEATRLCLLSGADPNVRSEDGLTPVHVSTIWGCIEVLELLLRSGGDPWLKDDRHMDAFQYAEKENQFEAFKLLSTFYSLDKRKDFHQDLSTVSPCTLELKRVLVYKNDLCVEYEATPKSRHTKSVHVQTTEPQLYQKKLEEESTEQNSTEFTYPSDTETVEWSVELNEYPFDNQVSQMITEHRKKTVLYESHPLKIATPKFESLETNSLRNKNSDIGCNLVKELTKHFENTSKVKIFFKQNSNEDVYTGKEGLQEKLEAKCKQAVDKPDGYIALNMSYGNVKEAINGRNRISEVSGLPDPPDIGFKLDLFTDEMNEGFVQDNNSLISETDSEVSISTSRQCFVQNLMTEEESSNNDIRVSSTSNTYVTCNEDYLSKDINSTTSNFSSLAVNDVVSGVVEHVNNNTTNSHLSGIQPLKIETDISEDFADEDGSEFHALTVNNKAVMSPTNQLDKKDKEENDCSMLATSGSPCGELGKEYDRLLNSKKWADEHFTYTSDEEEQEMSVSEEYQYTDTEEGIVLIEKRYLFDVSVPVTTKGKEDSSQKNKGNPTCSEESDISTLSRSTANYDTDKLRIELEERGFTNGPITGNTKRVYLRRLKRFRHKPLPLAEVNIPNYSSELTRTLTAVNLQQLLADWSHLELEMSSVFDQTNESTKWREGCAKTSFTYILLDPRITRNLPNQASTLPPNMVWSIFLQSIFYIGKGKRSRPYSHLYEAVSAWNNKVEVKSEKVDKILEIWRSKLGVVCLHVFHNIIPAEAYTREAAMISALSLTRLTNQKSGEFYGPAASWMQRQKRQLGVILLHRACQIFLAEGERQLRPGDID